MRLLVFLLLDFVFQRISSVYIYFDLVHPSSPLQFLFYSFYCSLIISWVLLKAKNKQNKHTKKPTSLLSVPYECRANYCTMVSLLWTKTLRKTDFTFSLQPPTANKFSVRGGDFVQMKICYHKYVLVILFHSSLLSYTLKVAF